MIQPICAESAEHQTNKTASQWPNSRLGWIPTCILRLKKLWWLLVRAFYGHVPLPSQQYQSTEGMEISIGY